MKFQLRRVEYMPSRLEAGIVYLSDRFGTAMHLCPCGCGARVVTPINAAEWSVMESKSGFSLHPSVGNWQLPCRSHYWIISREVRWSNDWTADQIEAGRLAEEARHEAHNKGLPSRKRTWLQKIWDLIKGLIGGPR